MISGDEDPFDTYDFQEEVSKDYPSRTIYFFLLGDKSAYDRNLSPSNDGMQALIQKVSKYAEVGIHPTYKSVDSPSLLQKEISRLRVILGEPIDKSRQHFLRFKLPETFRNLIKEGIVEEYSMGYADRPGFRSGNMYTALFFRFKKEYSHSAEGISFSRYGRHPSRLPIPRFQDCSSNAQRYYYKG